MFGVLKQVTLDRDAALESLCIGSAINNRLMSCMRLSVHAQVLAARVCACQHGRAIVMDNDLQLVLCSW